MIRQSGDTAGTPGCTLVGPCGSVELDHGVIVAKRHIHMTPVQAYQLNVKDNDSVFVITQSFERALIFADVIVRVSPQFALAMHVDTDEANAFAGTENPTGTLLKLFGGKSEELQRWQMRFRVYSSDIEYLLKTKNPSPKARSRYPPLVAVRKRKLVGAKNATTIMSQLSQILRQLLNMELEI